MSEIAINGRFLSQSATGIQRYGREMVKAMNVLSSTRAPGPEAATLSLMMPKNATLDIELEHIRSIKRGLTAGHLWMQSELPYYARGKVLWSPANIGPVQKNRHVVTLHDLSIYENSEWFNWKFAAGYKMVLPILMKRCAHVVTDSEYSRQGIIERFRLAPGKVSVVYPAASGKFRPAENEDIERVKSKYSLPQNYILSLGSVEPRKNIGRLLIAWSRVSNEVFDDVSLVIAGDRARTFADPGLAEQALSLSNVVFTGYFPDDDLPALYSGALAFVYPSVYEGFGLPPLEAMACGTVVLSSNSTSLPEVVGDAALAFDPYDVEAIEDGLRRVLLDELPRDKMRARGLERAKYFSWDESASQISNILEGV